MFIVLGGFQGERAGNDGSWSPGDIVASKEDARKWKGGVRERKKKQKDDMTGNVGKRKKTQSVDPGRE